ncbi:MAG TPA: hypothetical protein VMZ22_07970 [Acidimicrobiales bacterium]|nr:hypothetical protein [Acidimicrobiales bacterium]
MRLRTERQRWARGYYYGWARPRWWPQRFDYGLGPWGAYDDKLVTVFSAGRRCEFVPATLGPFRGHRHDGVLRPDAAEIAERLGRSGRPIEAAPALAVVSRFEGGFDSLQTYDRAKFTWGFIQFTALGGLPRLLGELKNEAPSAFADHVGSAGLDLVDGTLAVTRAGRQFVGRRALDLLHDAPELWAAFLALSQDEQVRDIQVRNAYDYFYAWPLQADAVVEGHTVSLGDLLGADLASRAVLFDRAVSWGVGGAVTEFRRAVAAVGRAKPRAVVEHLLDRASACDQIRMSAVVSESAWPASDA